MGEGEGLVDNVMLVDGVERLYENEEEGIRLLIRLLKGKMELKN